MGYAYSRESTPHAVTVITIRHLESGAVLTSVVVRKGMWPFIVALAADWLIKLNREPIMLRGDPEHALMAFLTAVKARMKTNGAMCEVEKGTVGSHQSIGGAEVSHDIVAGYARCMALMVKRQTGFEIEPQSQLFTWLIRHAGF